MGAGAMAVPLRLGEWGQSVLDHTSCTEGPSLLAPELSRFR